MAFTCGFFNSVNGDRKYNSRQISQIFDGIITDGVFGHYGTHFNISPIGNMGINVGSGRFWFNHVWGLNDGNLTITLNPADIANDRIDAVIVDIDESDSVRNAFITFVTGTPAAGKPAMISTSTRHQYPLAYVTVKADSTSISAANIQVVVGTSQCPFVTSVLDSVSVDNLFSQWDAQFTEWFSGIQATLDDNIVTNLINQINNLQQTKASKTELATVENKIGTYLMVNGNKYKVKYFDDFQSIMVNTMRAGMLSKSFSVSYAKIMGTLMFSNRFLIFASAKSSSGNSPVYYYIYSVYFDGNIPRISDTRASMISDSDASFARFNAISYGSKICILTVTGSYGTIATVTLYDPYSGSTDYARSSTNSVGQYISCLVGRGNRKSYIVTTDNILYVMTDYSDSLTSITNLPSGDYYSIGGNKFIGSGDNTKGSFIIYSINTDSDSVNTTTISLSSSSTYIERVIYYNENSTQVMLLLRNGSTRTIAMLLNNSSITTVFNTTDRYLVYYGSYGSYLYLIGTKGAYAINVNSWTLTSSMSISNMPSASKIPGIVNSSSMNMYRNVNSIGVIYCDRYGCIIHNNGSFKLKSTSIIPVNSRQTDNEYFAIGNANTPLAFCKHVITENIPTEIHILNISGKDFVNIKVLNGINIY